MMYPSKFQKFPTFSMHSNQSTNKVAAIDDLNRKFAMYRRFLNANTENAIKIL